MIKTLIILVLFISTSCRKDIDTSLDLRAKLRNHKVTKLQYWNKRTNTNEQGDYNLIATEEVIDYFNIMNQIDGFIERPSIVKTDSTWTNDVNLAFGNLPHKIRQLSSKWIKGVVFVKDLGGSGSAIELKNDKNEVKSVILVFDINAIDRKANQWCSWKETSPFKKSKNMQLICKIENESNNTRSNAFQYIMLHELGHFVYNQYKLDFPYDRLAKSQEDIDQYEISKLSWTFLAPFNGNSNEYVASKYDHIFPNRNKIVYYTPQPKLNLTDATQAYKNLKKTNFSTMYAANNMNDDVADSFVNYVHTVMMNKPFEILILKDKEVQVSYKSCWQEERCAPKRKIFEKYIELQLK